MTARTPSLSHIPFYLLLCGLSFVSPPSTSAVGSIYVTGMSDAEGPLNFSYYAQPIVGYDFVPNTSITIGALGVYDHLFNGLDRVNQVGLWERSSETLLASVNVPAGMEGLKQLVPRSHPVLQ
jgi:hypothetical protein